MPVQHHFRRRNPDDPLEKHVVVHLQPRPDGAPVLVERGIERFAVHPGKVDSAASSNASSLDARAFHST